MFDIPARVFVNERISSKGDMAGRLESLLVAFQAGGAERKFQLFAELASSALIASEAARVHPS